MTERERERERGRGWEVEKGEKGEEKDTQASRILYRDQYGT